MTGQNAVQMTTKRDSITEQQTGEGKSGRMTGVRWRYGNECRVSWGHFHILIVSRNGEMHSPLGRPSHAVTSPAPLTTQGSIQLYSLLATLLAASPPPPPLMLSVHTLPSPPLISLS